MKKLLLLLLCVPMIGFGQECESGDCENGYGVMNWGNCVEEDSHPFNECYWERGGVFKDGKINGLGHTSQHYVTYYPDGIASGIAWTFIGEYVNGDRTGIGMIKREDDSGYVGYWVNGKLIKTIAEF